LSAAIQIFFVSLNKFNITIGLLFAIQLFAAGQNINRQMVNQYLIQLPKTDRDSNRVKILLELGKFQIYKPGEVKTDLDSGLNYLIEARQLSSSLHLLKWEHDIESMLVIYCMESGDSLTGRNRFAKLVSDCENTGDKWTEAMSNYRLGIWLGVKKYNYPQAIDLHRRAAFLFKSINDQENEITALREIGHIHMSDGDVNTAETELLEVLDRYKAIKFPNLHYTYNLLSNVYRLKGDLNKGLYYALQCVESMEQTHDTLSAAYFYGDLARTYHDIGDTEKSIEWYKKSLSKWREEKLPTYSMFVTAGFIAQDLIDHNKADEALLLMKNLAAEIPPITPLQKACLAQHYAYCYDALHNYPMAEKYYIEGIDVFGKQLNQYEGGIELQRDIGKFYIKIGQLDKASSYLKNVLANVAQRNAVTTIKDVHLMLFRIDSAKGNYISAINHLWTHQALSDSILTETKSKQIEELQIRYETSKKEHEIELLTNQGKLQQAELKQGLFARNVTIAIVILLLLLIGMGYNRYRLKQRSNQLLQSQKQEIDEKNDSLQQLVLEKDKLLEEKDWLVKEVHHRVKNNLQMIISLLNAQSEFLNHPSALNAIRESKERMQAIAILHQKLYQIDNNSSINMRSYINELVENIKNSFADSGRVHFLVDVGNIGLDISQSAPLGLIINEAITNAIKYAYPKNEKGIIQISLQQIGANQLQLKVADHGRGLPADLDIEKIHSLGFQLIKLFSEQLEGDLFFINKDGLEIILNFRVPEYSSASPKRITA
jgi:two-component sensor histidine kinase